MNAEQIEELFKTSDRLVGAVSTEYHRYVFYLMERKV